MILEDLKKMENPYFPLTSKLLYHQFIGREAEITKLQNILDEYKKTSNLKNVIISGNKSIGKSSLMNRYKQLLQSNNFIVYEIELPRDASIEIDEFEFFKNIIDELFEHYAPPEGSFFNEEQSEIWFSLTSDKYNHESDFLKREIRFASQYANRKRGIEEKLSYKLVERDFEKIMDQLISTEMEIEGLAILVDEFQELSRNILILDILRQVSENLPSIMLIGAGLPTYLDNPIFEKFSRLSTTTNLRGMKENEILDLIFKPLESRGAFSRHEIRKLIHPLSVDDVVNRSGGNPLHVKILCSKMFDQFQNDPVTNTMELNRQVMENVMEYYSTISEKSNKIRLSLQSCRQDQLDAFFLLYQYDGQSIRAAILLELAFLSITPEHEEFCRNKIISAFRELWDFDLFEIKKSDIQLEELVNFSIDSLALIEYKFIGNAIDKLYASYYYEGLVSKKLIDNSDKDFEDILAIKFANQLNDFILSKKSKR